MSAELAASRPERTPIDWVFVVRGASRGLTVLLIGGAVQPWVGVLSRPLGFIWLALVAVLAFALAARPHRGSAGSVRDCMTAAVASYLLVLPLVVSAAGTLAVDQAFFTSLTAVVVGAFMGAFHRRRQSE
ncbi:hypothetical protein NODU109028_14520 [Nocardioides dubius]|uniref:SPW repeat-containing protein n=1 Tax=Nocardioides dubius TaxID=317019 RepID=A0ABN1TZF9_9ACTN